MTYTLFLAICGLLQTLEYSLAQELTCDLKVAKNLEEIAENDIFRYHFDKRELPYAYRFQYNTFASLDLGLLSKDEAELDLLENAFKSKMQIINQSTDVSNIIDEQKHKLQTYIKARKEVLDNSPTPMPDYIQLPLIEDDEIRGMLFHCKPCKDISIFSSCLQKEVDTYIKDYQKALEYYKTKEQQFKQFENINPKDFLNNATNKLMEIYKSYNRDITVQQVKNYYRNKLMLLNEQIVEAQESPENNLKTYITYTGYILRKSFQRVKDSMPFYKRNRVYDCKGLLKLDKILEAFDKIYSTYERLPEVNVESFAARYATPIQSITDVDALLHALETAIHVGREEAYPNPTKLLSQLGADIFSMLSEVDSSCSSYELSNVVGQYDSNVLKCIIFAFNGCKYPTCTDFLLNNFGNRPADIQKCYDNK